VGGSASSQDTPGASQPVSGCQQASSSRMVSSATSSPISFRDRDLGLEYETTQGSRCEAKIHMNSICGLWRDS
jgi:hypothetical protein